MKRNLCLFNVFLSFVMLFIFVGTAKATDPTIGDLLSTISSPPKGVLQNPFSSWAMWLSAVATFVVVYVAQWIPYVANALSYVRGFLRAIVIGGAVLICFIKYGYLNIPEALTAYITAGVVFEALENYLPKTVSSEIRAVRKDISNLPI